MMRRVVTGQHGNVIYVSGHDRVRVTHSVTGNGQKDVTGEYRRPIPRANTHHWSQKVKATMGRTGVLAAIGALALCLIADGATLLLVAGMT